MIYIANVFGFLRQAGKMKMHLNINRKEAFELKDLILPFTMQPDRFLTVNLILLLAEVLPSLPLTVLSYRTETMESLFFSLAASLVQSLIGLILSLFFGLSNYLLLDNPEMGAIESLKISFRLMKGNKGRYFYITLSFIPLTIACVFTCYIGLLWLEPYIANTMALFYMVVTGEIDNTRPKEEQPMQEMPFNYM